MAEVQNQESYIARTSGLKFKDYIGYGMGDAAGCLVFSLVTTLLQKFYTDVFNISPLFIMIMFIVARVWDAVNDPIMGRICDTSKTTKYGRYRPWFLRVAAPLAILTILMFFKWPGLGGDVNYLGTCIYATATYILWGMCYTVLQIPYGSLASVVTTDVGERNKLSVFRAVGAAVGSIPVMAISSFAYAKRIDANGEFVIGENGKIITDLQYKPVIIGVIIMSICSMLLLLLTFKLNKERVITKPSEKEKGATKKILGILLHNKAFISLSLTALLLLAGQMFTQSFYLYLFNDYFNANWMNMVSMACTYSPMIILMFFMPKLARKLGKKEICSWGMALAALANLAMFALRGFQPSQLILPFLILCFISGCGQTTVILQLWSMATDTIDDIEVKTGSRDDGTAYSIFNFFRKLGQVLAAICVNGSLLGMHYKYGKGDVQTLENLKKMYDMATLIPALMFGLMALLLFLIYPLSKKKVEELQVLKEAKLKESYENKTIDIE
ncbi:MAG: glycoside-pentoside-hexuronide (GPH):cation symporter [Treponema sp.]|nr:glycoside-pentoside-hexuronide (GPH):cation symporter [Treponema sp.]